LVAAAENECKTCTVSEWLLLNVFFILPYGSIAEVAASNLKHACKYLASLGNPLPFESACRPLPKGATGLQQVKELHDDGNAAVIPGIWTSLIGDETVVFRFYGRGIMLRRRIISLR
jgi:hypothetical protein